jgi:hypothetical protein
LQCTLKYEKDDINESREGYMTSKEEKRRRRRVGTLKTMDEDQKSEEDEKNR